MNGRCLLLPRSKNSVKRIYRYNVCSDSRCSRIGIGPQHGNFLRFRLDNADTMCERFAKDDKDLLTRIVASKLSSFSFSLLLLLIIRIVIIVYTKLPKQEALSIGRVIDKEWTLLYWHEEPDFCNVWIQ